VTSAEARHVVEALGLGAEVEHVVAGASEFSAVQLDALKAIFNSAKARAS
jgi:hypothetical protein